MVRTGTLQVSYARLTEFYVGVTDDTAAINAAISSGGRCGQGCDSTTVTPAVIYFPKGYDCPFDSIRYNY
jgi:glucan 1,3-beta-glucosidase